MNGSVDRLSVWAVRYALGRMTYAAHDVVDTLIAERANLTRQSCHAIIRDITEAESAGHLGMEMDAVAWRRLRDALAREEAGQERPLDLAGTSDGVDMAPGRQDGWRRPNGGWRDGVEEYYWRSELPDITDGFPPRDRRLPR